jgi:hypothetical protein
MRKLLDFVCGGGGTMPIGGGGGGTMPIGGGTRDL